MIKLFSWQFWWKKCQNTLAKNTIIRMIFRYLYRSSNALLITVKPFSVNNQNQCHPYSLFYMKQMEISYFGTIDKQNVFFELLLDIKPLKSRFLVTRSTNWLCITKNCLKWRFWSLFYLLKWNKQENFPTF